MKKFLLLLALAAVPVTLSFPALSQSSGLFKPKQSDLDKQREAQEHEQQYNQYNSYEQPFDFNFGQEEEEKETVINQYGSRYKKVIPGENPATEKILPNLSYKFYFVRKPGALPDEVTLRFITPLALSGCMNLEQPALKISENPPVIHLSVAEAGIILDKSVRYAHFQCDLRSQFAQVDLPLNRAALLEKGIRKIILSGKGSSRILDVNVNATEIEVVANTEIATFSFANLPGVNE